MPTYSTSTGERFTTEQIDRKTTAAKAQKIEGVIEEHGYVFCFDCQRNDCKPVDMSHNISVKEAKESGRAELCWDLDNLTPRGRRCHRIHDQTY